MSSIKRNRQYHVEAMRSSCLVISYILLGFGILFNMILPLNHPPFERVLFSSNPWMRFLSAFLVALSLNIFFWLGFWFRWYIDKISRPDDRSRWLLPFQIYTAVAVVILGFAGFRLISEPSRWDQANDALADYRLSIPIEREHIEQLIQRMKKEEEFKFYFDLLPPSRIKEAENEVFQILSQNWSSEALLERIEGLRQEITPVLAVYAYMDHEPYLTDPLAHPVMYKTLWDIFYTEFKTTILGLVYKTNFDRSFNFIWDEDAQRFAQNFRAVIEKLQADANP